MRERVYIRGGGGFLNVTRWSPLPPISPAFLLILSRRGNLSRSDDIAGTSIYHNCQTWQDSTLTVSEWVFQIWIYRLMREWVQVALNNGMVDCCWIWYLDPMDGNDSNILEMEGERGIWFSNVASSVGVERWLIWCVLIFLIFWLSRQSDWRFWNDIAGTSIVTTVKPDRTRPFQ